MALKFAMILEAVDRMSRPAKRAANGTHELTKGARQLSRQGAPAARAIDRVSNAAGRLGARFTPALIRVRQMAGRAGMRGLELGAIGAGKAIGSLVGLTARLAINMAKIGVATALAFAGATIGNIFRVGRSFEDLEVRLAEITGSSAKAKSELRSLFDLKLPVRIEQLADAYVQLREAGIDPSRQSMKALVGESIRSKKSIDELLEALVNAKNGKFDGLGDLGVNASSKKGVATFQYLDRNGNRILKRVADNSREVEKTLLAIFDERSRGHMERYSKSLAGIGVQLGNWWQHFSLKIADAGIYDMFRSKMKGLLDWLDARMADGSVNRWAKNISTELENVLKWIESITKEDFDRFKADFRTMANGVRDVASALASVYGWVKKIDSAWAGVDAWVDRWQIGGSGWGELIRGQPQPKRQRAPMTAGDRDRWRGALQPKTAPRASPIGIRGTPINPAFLQTPSPRDQQQPVGKITLDVRTDRGTTVHAREMKATNLDIAVAYRGGAMRSFG